MYCGQVSPKIFSPFFCAWRSVSMASISDMCTSKSGASTRRANEIARLVASASATRAWAMAWNFGATCPWSTR
jgi:hypothetical protein